MNNPLPFVPEALKSLQERYDDAVMVEWIVSKDMKETPSQLRDHVFDCEDGIRMIISKEILPNNSIPVIHFSTSLDWQTKETKKWLDLSQKNPKLLHKKLCDRYREISQDTEAKPEMKYISTKGVLHFLCLPKIKKEE